ncbi:thioredoxin [Pseudomonas rhodesiae]|nr:thioredoxin [Pseudomonas rhodesiae]
MSNDLIKHVTDATFDAEVLKAQGPVLVDYWAEWCGPCKMIAPVLDDIAMAYEGKLTIAKLNIDENQETPAKHGVRGIPTLMLFKNGNVEATKVGALSKSQFASFPRRQHLSVVKKAPQLAGLFRKAGLDAPKFRCYIRPRTGFSTAPCKPSPTHSFRLVRDPVAFSAARPH